MTTKEGINIAITVIGVAGLTGMVVVAPSASATLTNLLGKLIPDEPVRKRVFSELMRQKLIQVDPVSSGMRVSITPNGAHRLLALQADEVSIPKMKIWDMHWRVVSFDIPTGKNKERAYFNRRLHELNFTMIQKSMWIHPFECVEQLRIVTDFVNLTRYVSIMEVVKLDEITTRKLLRRYEHLLHT